MPVPNLLDKKFVGMSDQELFDTIGKGKNHREYAHTFLYTGMDQQQVESLVAHIRKLQRTAK